MATALLLLAILSACNLVRVEEEQELSLSAEGIDTLLLELDEGDVLITGEDRMDIALQAVFFSMHEDEEVAERFKEENMAIFLDKNENVAHLHTKILNTNQHSVQGRIHVTLQIPIHLFLDIHQEAGALTINNVTSDININAGPGEIKLEGIAGAVKIIDGTGAIVLRNINGDYIDINNGSGALLVEDVSSNLNIISGSGDISIASIEGSVTMRSGSGDIEVDTVTGDVTVLENRSGKVDIQNVEGTILQ